LPEFRQISPSILGREFVTAEAANLCRGLHGLSALRADLRWLRIFLHQAHGLRFSRLERRQRQNTRITTGVSSRQRKNQPTPDHPLLLATIAPTIARTIQIVRNSTRVLPAG